MATGSATVKVATPKSQMAPRRGNHQFAITGRFDVGVWHLRLYPAHATKEESVEQPWESNQGCSTLNI